MSDPQRTEANTADGTPPSPAAKPAVEVAQTHVTKDFKHGSPLISCRFDPQGQFIFAGAQDNSVVRWAIPSGEAVQLKGHDSWVRALVFDAAGDMLVTGGFDGRLIWWEPRAAEPVPVRRVEAHDGWVRAVTISADGQLLATAGNDHLVKIWDRAEGRPIATLEGHDCHVYNVAFHPHGDGLVSADLKGVVKQWDISSGENTRSFDAGALYIYDKGFRADIGGARSMAFSPDGQQFACGGITNVTNAFAGVGNPTALRFDWQNGKIVQNHITKAKPRGVIWGLAFLPDGYLVGASGGGGGGFLYFWKEDQGEEVHTMKLPSPARDLDLMCDGVQLATAHYDGHLRILAMREKQA